MRAADPLTVNTPIMSADDREAIAVPGDRLWVVTVQGARMRVRCPETHLDAWFDTDDGRFTPTSEDVR